MLVGSARRRAIVTSNTEPASRIRAWESGANIEAQLRPRPRANATPARAGEGHRRPLRGSDSRLPGARHAGLADRVLDGEAGVARFRLRAQASRDGVQEAAHQRHVGVADVQLFFDAVNGFDQILLIAARKSHASYGMLYGNQRLMYRGLFRPIHGSKFEPVCGKPQAPASPPANGRARKQEPRLWCGAQ